MTLSTERLNRAKEDLAKIVAAIEVGDNSGLSQEGRRLLDELVALDDAEWEPLLANLEDSDLRAQLDLLRGKVTEAKESPPAGTFSRIVQVGPIASFNLTQRSLTIPLRFETWGDQSLDSSQDLEDTLWIGATVMTVVSDVMQAMEGTLGPDTQRDCIGQNFEDNLKSAEEALAEIRRIFTTVRGADTPNDVD